MSRETRWPWAHRIVACLMGVLVVGTDARAADPAEFELYNYDLVTGSGVELPGRLFVPADYDPNKRYSLLMTYHGLGGKGGNNESQVRVGFMNPILAKAKDAGIEDFFIYAPQSFGGWWNDSQVQQSMNMVYRATRDYNIDPGRVYLAGNSSGGGGTWKAMIKYHDILAAAVPVAGNGQPHSAEVGQAMAGEPIWAFHARNDGVVGVSSSRRSIDEIRQGGSLPALVYPSVNDNTTQFFVDENNLRYTEYPTGGHGIAASTVFNQKAVYDWMFAQSNPGPPDLRAGEKVLFDLGAATTFTRDTRGNHWNTLELGNERTEGVALAYAQTTGGDRTGVALLVSDTFTHHDRNGVVSDAVYATTAQSDSVWTGAGNHAAALQETAELIFAGLVAGGEYSLKLFASRAGDDGGLGYVARYVVDGLYRDLDASDNTQNLVIFESLFADANGEIRLTVGVSPDSLSRYAHLGVIELAAVNIPEPNTVCMVVGLFTALLGLRRRRD